VEERIFNRKERKEAQSSEEKSAFIRSICPISVLSILQRYPELITAKSAKKRKDLKRNPPSSAQSAQSAFYHL
jgi:hypothetical protein